MGDARLAVFVVFLGQERGIPGLLSELSAELSSHNLLRIGDDHKIREICEQKLLSADLADPLVTSSG